MTLAHELEQLGLIGRITAGGVLVRGDLAVLRRLLQRSRVAQSVRARLKPFRAANFRELEAGFARLPWHAYFEADARPEFRVSCRRSRLYHSGAVEERALQGFQRGRRCEQLGEGMRVQRVYVRIERDWVQVSIDASGPLYRRGYRTHVGEASLRETLAAVAAHLLLQHDPAVVRVWDPFCGSGVLPLEWELSRSAGLAHTGPFPMDSWPIAAGRGHSPAATPAHAANSEARAAPVGDGAGATGPGTHGGPEASEGSDMSDAAQLSTKWSPCLWLSDVSPRAQAAARHNAQNAGLLERCRFLTLDFDEAAVEVPRGTAILCNPPYGVRLGSETAARRTLRRFEQRLRARPDLRPALVLCPWQSLGQRQWLPWKQLAQFPNGGVQISAHWLPRVS